jgi:protein O-mannosyl-transferase
LPSPATKLQKSKSVPEPPRDLSSPAKNRAIACLLLAVATLAFYNPVAHCGFVYSDDIAYVTRNPQVRAGLTWATVQWAFSTPLGGFWHPLTWLSHALDYQLFGMNAAGHHYVSLLLHTGSAVLLFLVLFEATGAGWPSLIVAALFALHPQNVESVAWAAERKNVLSMFFFMLALWAYGRYVREGGTKRYLGVMALFALGMMAKTQIITLPCVLLLWDYWPLGRMSAPANGDSKIAPRSFSYLAKEKLPLFAIAAVGAALTMWAQREASALRTFGEYPLSVRLANAVVAYARYLAHTFWPVDLNPIYPHPGVYPPLLQVAGAALLLAAITTLVILRKDQRYLAVGWFWFLGTLVPMIGIIQVGEQAMADRYSYQATVGIFIMLAWAGNELVERKQIAAAWIAIPAVLAIMTLGVLTYRQLSYWHDGETLWNYAVSLNQRSYVAHENLAMALDGDGKPDGAISEFRAAEELHDAPAPEILKIGVYEQRNGHFQGAIEQYQRALAKSSDAQLQSVAWGQIGSASAQLANYDQAQQSYAKALQLNPNDSGALVASALLAERRGDFDQAAGQFQHALRVEPSDVVDLLVADALRHAGRYQEAAQAQETARKITADLEVAKSKAAQTQLFFGYKAN